MVLQLGMHPPRSRAAIGSQQGYNWEASGSKGYIVAMSSRRCAGLIGRGEQAESVDRELARSESSEEVGWTSGLDLAPR